MMKIQRKCPERKKIAVLIASNGFVSVRRKCSKNLRKLQKAIWDKIGWQSCFCRGKCKIPYHLSNVEGCLLKCFGGSGSKFQHKNESLSFDGALKSALCWGADCIFLYPDVIQNSIFNKPGCKNLAIPCSEVGRKLTEACDVPFMNGGIKKMAT